MVALDKEMQRFRRDRRGNVALAFGLALVPMVGSAGMVLDLQAAATRARFCRTKRTRRRSR